MHVYQIDEDKKSFHLNTAEPEADDGHPEASKPLVTSCALWHRQALDPTLRRACHPSVSPQRLFTWTELISNSWKQNHICRAHTLSYSPIVMMLLGQSIHMAALFVATYIMRRGGGRCRAMPTVPTGPALKTMVVSVICPWSDAKLPRYESIYSLEIQRETPFGDGQFCVSVCLRCMLRHSFKHKPKCRGKVFCRSD